MHHSAFPLYATHEYSAIRVLALVCTALAANDAVLSVSLSCVLFCAYCAVTGASYGHVLGALGGDLSLAPELLQAMTDEGTTPDLQVLHLVHVLCYSRTQHGVLCR
jgi:hypothetical protein